MAQLGFDEAEQSFAIDISATGNTTLIAAPATPGSFIAIDFLQLFVPNAVGVQLFNGASKINGKYSFQSGQNVTIENSPRLENGIITIDPGNAFILNLDAAQQCSGFIRYRIMNF